MLNGDRFQKRSLTSNHFREEKTSTLSLLVASPLIGFVFAIRSHLSEKMIKKFSQLI